MKTFYLLLTYFILCFYPYQSHCQDNEKNTRWGLGIQFGAYSSFGENDWLINYFVLKNLDLGTSVGYSYYQGFCTGIIANYSPVYREKGLNLIANLNYTSFFDHSFNEGIDDNHIGKYKVKGQNYFVPGIGLRKDFINPGKIGCFSIRLVCTYRFSSENATVTFLGGVKSSDYENMINNKLETKLGINISLVVYGFQPNWNPNKSK